MSLFNDDSKPGSRLPVSFNNLKDIPPLASSAEPDPYTRQHKEDLEHQHHAQKIKHERDEHQERIKYANKIYRLSVIWLAVVILMVIANGIDIIPFSLDNSVVITLLTTTTATVLGLFISVLNYLFYRKK
ncbi:hypothetical protein MAH1_22560 [Sessilibacter sp. MAH1]